MPSRSENRASGPHATYRVSVVGELGPVLQASFSDYQSFVVPRSTVFHLRVPAGRRLCDISKMLSAQGLDVLSLRLLPDIDHAQAATQADPLQPPQA